MTNVKIYRPSKTATQSGRAKTHAWVIEHELGNVQYVEPVMKWTASTSTQAQVVLKFATKEEAVAFAVKKGWGYRIVEAQDKKIQPKSYTDNFIRS